MENLKNIGLIDCGSSTGAYQLDGTSLENGFTLKKILPAANSNTGLIKSLYPQAEIVLDKQAIINDESIGLVILTSTGNGHLAIVAEALQAGKQVRVI